MVSKKVEVPKPSNIYEKINEVDENGDWKKMDMKVLEGVSGVDKGEKEDHLVPMVIEARGKGDSL